LLVADLTAPTARAAIGGRFPGSGTGAATILANFVAADSDLSFCAEYRFIELECDVLAEVGSALRTRTTAAAASAKEVPETEKFSEDVAEILKHGGIEAARTAAYAGMPESVVHGTLLAINQDRVGFRYFFELFFGVGIVGVAVGVILQRELAISTLNLLLIRRSRYTQDFVIVALSVTGQNRSSPRCPEIRIQFTSSSSLKPLPWMAAAGGL
jgi:hypothetical protein